MKNLIVIFYTFFCGISFFSCVNREFLKEGVIGYRTYFIDYNATTKLPIEDTSENRIWFYDSSVIYEIKFMRINTDNTSKGAFEKVSFDFFKYTYLDLRTMRCQDYFNLKDTAIPIDNYIMKGGQGLGWEFFNPKQLSDTVGIMSLLPDTIVSHNNYSRIKIKSHSDTLGYNFEFYVDCNTKNNIFHLNRTLDEMYPRCKTVRKIMKFENYPFSTVFETKIVADTLSKEIKKIFSRWAKNAATTKLILISLPEVNELTMKYLN